ncbi:nucleotide pyrophosphohydrolase [Saccharopolyspora aridisoli]|uniref:Nucleotide pyrophosphohydrolase n=1 Tax=Saccharopolyspora aridisoli TaxID=2530385 RepID=A0A4R4USR1_9PSEU|nr:nucleotide pyrophosphohydrolase [Saccharopolyspora aridisoli]TDC95408.1 nucleotide pyrophosphohydrolase [Saccharopolyspora aridisoli]
MTLEDFQRRLRDFADERDWQQFHTPKNLAMALAGEAGELLELFQWLTPEQSSQIMADPATGEKVRHELADVLAYLLRLADVLEIDLMAALDEKMTLNATKYPVELAKGTARKYDQLGQEDL